uniref:PA domain-containing protein n=1 Tax=Biomphalaria glabrata TaxID=6526 RepID=A0A2C9LG79_BIOGL
MYTFKLKQAKDFGTVFDKLHEDVELILADPEDDCQDLLNEIHGAVVLIRCGECSFLAKSKTAEKAGALAAIIFDNDETRRGTSREGGSATVTCGAKLSCLAANARSLGLWFQSLLRRL